MSEPCQPLMADETGSSEALPFKGVGLSMQTRSHAHAWDNDLTLVASRSMWALVSEFPSVPWALMDRPPSDALVIPEQDWRAPSLDLYAWDRAVGASRQERRWLVVQAEEDSRTLFETARQVLTRYQRFVPRANADSKTPEFRRVLSRHRALHDMSLPLVRADYDHALDVWQWTLRLEPSAGLAPQLAALFHDIERLTSEAERRVEHTASDYQAFKNAHASAGARQAAGMLAECGIERWTIDAVARLIREHERPREAPESGDAGLLADADSLSFFSLNSPGFADYYGPEHTRRKVRYTLGRMSPGALCRLAGIRLRADVAHLLAEVSHEEASATLMAVGA